MSRYRRDSPLRHRTTTDQVPTSDWWREHQSHVVGGDGKKNSQKRIYEHGGWTKDTSAYRGTAPNQARRTPQACLEADGVRVRDRRSAKRRLSTSEVVSRASHASHNNCDVSFSSRQGQEYIFAALRRDMADSTLLRLFHTGHRFVPQ